MSKICQRHIEKPVKIYSQCVGCELEWFEEECERLQKENDDLAEALRKILNTPQGVWKSTTGEGHAECLKIAREVLRKYGLEGEGEENA